MSLHGAEHSTIEATGLPEFSGQVIRATSNIGRVLIQQGHKPRDSHMIIPVCYVNQNRQIIYETIFFSVKQNKYIQFKTLF